MPEIRPFAGILYDRTAVSLPEAVAPPYDVIRPEQRSALYDRSPYNAVRLILGREADPYAEAARTFATWLREGVMRRERKPALYLLTQTFRDLEGRERRRTGFIGACRLEEPGSGAVIPHERTLAKPKEDRLRLFEATGAMFSQIFSLYSDSEQHLDRLYDDLARARPLCEVAFDGVDTSIHRISDPALQGEITGFLAARPVLIADGHHRYETALAYRNARRNPGASGDEPWQFVPMFFTNMHGSGLVIYPTHRLVHGMADFDGPALLEELRAAFEVSEIPDDEALVSALPASGPHAFGLILAGRARPLLLKARREAVSPHARGDGGLLWRLDVTVLHELVFKEILGMSDDMQLHKRFLEYEHDARRAVEAARSGSAQALFLMNPTPVEDVRVIASAGQVMPQKSTYFYPKLLSGLVTYSFKEGE